MQQPDQRRAILDEGWAFCPDIFSQGFDKGFWRKDFNDSKWKRISAPLAFDGNVTGHESYYGRAWYRRTLDCEAFETNERVILRFGSVNHRCKVFVNSVLAGEYNHGFLPFALDITPHITKSPHNTLAVWVDGRLYPDSLMTHCQGWRNHGGILREVELYAAGSRRVSRCKLNGIPTLDGGQLHYHIAFADDNGSQEIPWTLSVADNGKLLLQETHCTGLSYTGSLVLHGITPWSPDNPKLYDITITVEEGSGFSDRIGFRKLDTIQGRICLNGKPIRLFGFNRHEDTAKGGNAYSPDTAREDLQQMKAMGCNFVRLCHYPHDEYTYRLCDELGLISWAEIPLYWFNRPVTDPMHEQVLQNAEAQLIDMVECLYNRTSIGFWCVSNEGDDTNPDIVAANTRLESFLQSRIPNGFRVHVSIHYHKDSETNPCFAADDVICINGYPNTTDNQDGSFEISQERASAFWPETIAQIHARYPGKPILVTEFGFPALPDAHDLDWSEEMQEKEILTEAAAIQSSPYISGMAIWCWADHHWPPAHYKTASPAFEIMDVSPFGVLQRDRSPKKVFHALQKRIPIFTKDTD